MTSSSTAATRALDELLVSSSDGEGPLASAPEHALVARALLYASRRAHDSGALVAAAQLLAEAERCTTCVSREGWAALCGQPEG